MDFIKPVFIIVTVFLFQTARGQANDTCDNLSIIGGHKVAIEDVPYIVSIFENGDGFCGGSIIHEQFILTAAHCIDENSTLQVLVGSDRLTTGGILIDVEDKLCHEDYDNTCALCNDICLLKLVNPVPFGCKVAKISLPDTEFEIEDGTMVNVTGWGNMAIYDIVYPNDLRQVTVPIVSDECCRRIYPNMTDSMICAGSRGHDSCQGDSGGPLTYGNVQIGVVSFGNGCAIVAGVYTRVSNYLEWIDSTINENLNYFI